MHGPYEAERTVFDLLVVLYFDYKPSLVGGAPSQEIYRDLNPQAARAIYIQKIHPGPC